MGSRFIAVSNIGDVIRIKYKASTNHAQAGVKVTGAPTLA